MDEFGRLTPEEVSATINHAVELLARNILADLRVKHSFTEDISLQEVSVKIVPTGKKNLEDILCNNEELFSKVCC